MDQLRGIGQIPKIDAVAAALSFKGSRLLLLRIMAEVIAAEAALSELDGQIPVSGGQLKLVSDPLPPLKNSTEGEPIQAALDAILEDSDELLGCSKQFFQKMEQLEAERGKLIAELKVSRAQSARSKSQGSATSHLSAVHDGPEQLFGL